jgi:hypothetical protein
LCKGVLCETLICDKDPIKCGSYSSSQCLFTDIDIFCPSLCGKCIVFTTSTSTTVAPCSNAFGCLNGGKFNLETCSCICNTAYSG